MRTRYLPDTPLRFPRTADEAFSTPQYANPIEPPPRRSRASMRWLVLFGAFAALCLYHLN